MNTEDMDYYEYEESKKRFSPKKIVKFIFSLIAAAVIITVFVLIFARMRLIQLPNSFKGLTWTDAAVELYGSDKEFDYIYYPLGETYEEDGLYHISNIAMSETTGEVQFTMRYNKRSTVNKLMQLYGLTERPSGELFVYVLTDSFGNTYTDYVFAEDSNSMQEFRRVIFTGVGLSELIAEVNPADTTVDDEAETTSAVSGDTLTLTVYYGEDVSEMGKMNASFVLYDSAQPYDEPTFKKAGTSSLEFFDAPVYTSHLDTFDDTTDASEDTTAQD